MNPQPGSRWRQPAPDSLAAARIREGKSPWRDTIHLLGTVWVFIVPTFTSAGYDLRWALLTVAAYPLFLVLYLGAYWLPRCRVGLCALGIVALSFALLPWYPGGLSFFVFGCVLLGAGVERPLWVYLAQGLALSAALLVFARWLGYPWGSLAWMPVTVLLIGALIHVERKDKRKDAALKLSHDEVRRLAATAERERIGRDLHDLLGHTLSLITLKLELARKLSERDPAASRREIAEAERVARDALAEVRGAVTGFRAADLAGELAAAKLLLESSQVQLDYDAVPPLPADSGRALALVLREAATNIVRHARATHARVGFARAGGGVQMRIEDNGRGGIGADGNGLRGMRERIAAFGGSLSIESPKGQGTRVLARLPARGTDAAAAAESDGGASAPMRTVRVPSADDPHPAGRGPGDGARRAGRAARPGE
ncbi:MAG: sensor histidine kinase [Pseudoxanthomonas sp.]